MTQQTRQNAPVSPIPAGSGPDPGKNTRTEARGGVFSGAVDPDYLPGRRSRLWLLAVALLGVAALGRAAWPVIDVSAVQQLVETVRLATDQLDQVTAARQALLGEIANYTGVWDDLAGLPYELGEQASGAVSTAQSLTTIDADLLRRRNAESAAWPTQGDVRSAYAGSKPDVITQVLAAHQASTGDWDTQRSVWHDTQIVIGSAGRFLDAVQATADTQNATTDPGLSAQLDRNIAVSSATRDIAAKHLELAVAAEQRAVRLEHREALERARRRRQALAIRSEINAAIENQQAGFDSDSFDRRLYAPVLPSYGPDAAPLTPAAPTTPTP